MIRLALFTCMILFGLYPLAQLNMTQLGYLDLPTNHSTKLNGIWGYTDELGNEYALCGTEDGVSIVDITIPANPTEIAFISGQHSIWREIKTNGDYAYVTTEAAEGLLIIDLSPLPGSTALPTAYYTGPVGNPWNTAHSLFATGGYVYINGSGRGNGGLIILDVATDPMNPIEVGEFDTWYVHDCYVRNDTAYLAHIYDGFFSVLDVTDKSNPVLLGSAMTPTNFSHNIWTSTDGNYAFTTDEVSGGFIGAFDVTDPSNIVYLDKIQSSPGSGIVPHNAHVNGNYLVTSYYADGVVVHDITYPNNLVEVGNHDTNPHENPNTSGCWGVYPYFPSGHVVASDREEGLYVFAVDYQPGAYLEGTVTEMGTGNPINNVQVSLDGQEITDYSGVTGNYATGIATGGTYNVTYFKILYYPQTISTTLANGLVASQDVVLEKIPQFNLTVEVLDALTLNPVENAMVELQHTYIAHEGTTDANGLVTLGLYYQDNYDLFAGKWGLESACYADTLILNSSGTITLYVSQGYYDDFTFDFGWISAGDADRGLWEREKPVGVVGTSGFVQNPAADISWDCGNFAYLTGNGTMASNTEEVNGGEAVLISPVFDLTAYADPHINYTSWFYNQFGYEPVNDTLRFYLFDGTSTVLIDKKSATTTNMSHWVPNSIRISDYLTPGPTMQLIVTLSDELTSENITEGGIDYFSITDYSLLSNSEENTGLLLYPNPANEFVKLGGITNGWVLYYDMAGRLVLTQPVEESQKLGSLTPGVYLLRILDDEWKLRTIQKLIIE